MCGEMPKPHVAKNIITVPFYTMSHNSVTQQCSQQCHTTMSHITVPFIQCRTISSLAIQLVSAILSHDFTIPCNHPKERNNQA